MSYAHSKTIADPFCW